MRIIIDNIFGSANYFLNQGLTMSIKPLVFALSTCALLTACGGGSNNNTPAAEAPVDGGSSNLSTPPTTYTFETKFSGFDSGTIAISYTGQTARQMMIEELVTKTLSYTSDDINAQVASDLTTIFENNAGTFDTQQISFSRTGVTFIPQTADPAVVNGTTTFADISSGKSLVGKVAGNDTGMDIDNATGVDLVDGLVDINGDGSGEFYGWNNVGVFVANGEAGTNAAATGNRPEDFVLHLFGLLETQVTDNISPQIPTVAGNVGLDVSYVDGQGRDFRQLIQKFLLGAVTFSQGTSDYLQTDFSADNVQDGTSSYTSGAHDWDEAFGYFGAARDYNDYDDEEIAGNSGRTTYQNGYFNTNGDEFIDLRSEINLANSTNCAKRDLGSTTNTDFSKEVFDAFLKGRSALSDAAQLAADANGQADLTAEQAQAVEEAGDVAALVWEKCIAATVVHYINDVTSDINSFNAASYTDLTAYKDLAKHWAEMKGFAMGLQFNVESPIYASTSNTQQYHDALEAMGLGPVLATATAQEITDYLAGLATARQSFQDIYSFDATDVANW